MSAVRDVSISAPMLLTAKEAALVLGVSRAKFYQIRHVLPVVVLPRGTRRYVRQQLEWWLANNTQIGSGQKRAPGRILPQDRFEEAGGRAQGRTIMPPQRSRIADALQGYRSLLSRFWELTGIADIRTLADDVDELLTGLGQSAAPSEMDDTEQAAADRRAVNCSHHEPRRREHIAGLFRKTAL